MARHGVGLRRTLQLSSSLSPRLHPAVTSSLLNRQWARYYHSSPYTSMPLLAWMPSRQGSVLLAARPGVPSLWDTTTLWTPSQSAPLLLASLIRSRRPWTTDTRRFLSSGRRDDRCETERNAIRSSSSNNNNTNSAVTETEDVAEDVATDSSSSSKLGKNDAARQLPHSTHGDKNNDDDLRFISGVSFTLQEEEKDDDQHAEETADDGDDSGDAVNTDLIRKLNLEDVLDMDNSNNKRRHALDRFDRLGLTTAQSPVFFWTHPSAPRTLGWDESLIKERVLHTVPPPPPPPSSPPKRASRTRRAMMHYRAQKRLAMSSSTSNKKPTTRSSLWAMNRNARRPRKANKGKRPCSRVSRRARKRAYGNHRRG